MTDFYETTDAAWLNTLYTLEIGDRFFGHVWGGGLDEEGDNSDTVRFSVNAGDTIHFYAEYLPGADAGFGVYVSVLDSDGDYIRQTDTTLVQNGSEYTFLTAGTYYATASAGDVFDSGDYRLDLTYGTTPDTLDFVTPLATYFGDISVVGEIDTLNVNVEEGVSYRIMLDGADHPDFDPEEHYEDPQFASLHSGEFRLKDANGAFIGEALNNDDTPGRVLIFTADATQTMKLDVFGYEGIYSFNTGAYSVQLDRIDIINGTDFADTLDGTNSADAMNGYAGNDTIFGENGDDLIYGETGKDRVWDGKGADTVSLGDGNDYVRVGGGEDSFDGGSGKDYISYYDSRNGVTVDLANNEVSGSWAVNDTITGFESASGSKTGGDTMTGTSDANTFRTYGGEDRVFAGKGEDRVYLGAGDDYVRVGGGEETFDGGSGKDYISYYDSRNGVTVDLATDEVSGSWAVNDTITGFESVSGSKTGSDTLCGTDTDNTLRGYGGNDTLEGREGRDKLYGGADADVFVFRAGFGHDQIKDFEAGIDTIQLVGFGFDDDTDLSAYVDADGSGAVLSLTGDDTIAINLGSTEDLLDSITFG